jgi:hypothetical protein
MGTFKGKKKKKRDGVFLFSLEPCLWDKDIIVIQIKTSPLITKVIICVNIFSPFILIMPYNYCKEKVLEGKLKD